MELVLVAVVLQDLLMVVVAAAEAGWLTPIISLHRRETLFEWSLVQGEQVVVALVLVGLEATLNFGEPALPMYVYKVQDQQVHALVVLLWLGQEVMVALVVLRSAVAVLAVVLVVVLVDMRATAALVVHHVITGAPPLQIVGEVVVVPEGALGVIIL